MIIAMRWIAIKLSQRKFSQMMDSFGFGQILLIGALICWVVYTLLARKVLAGIDSLTATTLSSILVLLLFMSALCVESADDWLTVLNLSQGEWISLLGLAFGATVLAYAWYFDGVKYLGAGNASAYIILMPILGILFSAIWLNEQVDSSLIIGVF